MEEEFDKYLKWAMEYAATKDLKKSYCVEVIEEPIVEPVATDVVFTDKEVARINAIKAKYGDDYISHLNEFSDDGEFEPLEDIIGFNEEIVDIHTDYFEHPIKFGAHVYVDGQIQDRCVSVNMKKEEYVELLAWHLFDEHLTMNILYHRDRSLYSRIIREGDRYLLHWDFYCTYPYFFTMDEAIEDADRIREQHGLKKEGWQRPLYY